MLPKFICGRLQPALRLKPRFYATLNAQNQQGVTIVEVGPRDGLQNEKVNTYGFPLVHVLFGYTVAFCLRK